MKQEQEGALLSMGSGYQLLCVASSHLSMCLSRGLDSSSYPELPEELSSPHFGLGGTLAYCFWGREGTLSFSSLPLLRHQHGDETRVSHLGLLEGAHSLEAVPQTLLEM